MGRVKEIRLYPTCQSLRVYVGFSKKQMSEIFDTVYDCGYYEKYGYNFTFVETDKQKNRWFCIFLKNKDIPTVVHECFHVLQSLSKLIESEIVGSKENPYEEWSAYLLEYMVENVLNKEGYKEYGKNTRRKAASNSTRNGKHSKRASEV